MVRVQAAFSRYRTLMLMVADITCVIAGYVLAMYVRLDFNWSNTFNLYGRAFESLVATLPWVVGIHVFYTLMFKVNKSLWRYISVSEVFSVVMAVAFSNLTWLVVVVAIPVENYIRSIPVIASFIIVIELLSLRIVYRLYRRQKHRRNKNLRAVIIGAGDAGSILGREITYTERYQSKLVGYIDDDPSKRGKLLLGIPVLGTSNELMAIASKHKVDIAYIAIPSASREEIKRLLEMCQEIQLRVKIMNYQEDKLNENGDLALRDVSIEDLLGRGEVKLKTDELKEYITDEVVLVTGAGGSIGSELCRQLLKYEPKQLIMIDFYENNLYELQQEIKMKRRCGKLYSSTDEIYLIANVREKSRIDDIIQQYKPSVVYHAAAHKHVPLMEDSPKEAIKNNVLGTYNVVKSCVEHYVDRFILISTDKAVNPTNVMGASKRMCELIVQGMKDNGHTKIGAVRFGNVLGSHGSVIPLFKQQIASGGPITVTDKDIIRYFMTIPEAAQLVLQAGAYANHGEIFVLDMGKPVKILQLAEDLVRFSGLKPYEDIDIVFTGLRPGEKMYEELILDEENHRTTDNKLIFIAEPTDITSRELREKLQTLSAVMEQDLPNNEVKDYLMNCIETNGRDQLSSEKILVEA